jgi:mercuric ion transport protein
MTDDKNDADGGKKLTPLVQLLHFPGCPHVDAARAALRAAGISFDEVDVTAPGTPAALRNWGSPTILVDGRDVAGSPQPTGLSCRLYSSGDAPSVEMLHRALRHREP